MAINLSQVILDFDVKTELTSIYNVIPTSGRNLEYKPISEQQRFLPLVEMTFHLKLLTQIVVEII
jgi:hypothetical protein